MFNLIGNLLVLPFGSSIAVGSFVVLTGIWGIGQVIGKKGDDKDGN